MSFSALRKLGVDDQVALLFALLIGTLALVSMVTLLLSLRERAGARSLTSEQFRGDLRAAWVGTLLFWLAWVWTGRGDSG